MLPHMFFSKHRGIGNTALEEETVDVKSHALQVD